MENSRIKPRCRLLLELTSYGDYIEEAYKLEAILARKPKRLQIDMVGYGEIPPDSVLLIRSILLGRSPQTHIITNARSSLRGASVLVWLMGDTRIIREDAKLYFRSAGPFESSEGAKSVWKDRSFLGDDEVEESDYIQVLQSINEFLPVKELAGRPVELLVLRQFGLVDNEKVDRFLVASFRKESRRKEKQQLKLKKPPPKKPDVSI
jgi:hypothetical protein